MIFSKRWSIYRDLELWKKSKRRKNKKNAAVNFKVLFNQNKAINLMSKKLKEDSLKSKQMLKSYWKNKKKEDIKL
jgi:hypothetical protein